MKRFALQFTAGLCFAVLIFSSCAFRTFDDYNDFVTGCLRFHVVASSNKKEDIAVKECVARELSEYTKAWFDGCESVEQAKNTAVEKSAIMEQQANRVLAQKGFDYKAQVLIKNKAYNTRTYGGKVYPAGKYCSVEVKLGKGEGSNFWCVLFPGVCSAGTQNSQDGKKTKLKLGFTELFK